MMAAKFADELLRTVPWLDLSIRGIRSIVFRIFSLTLSKVSVGERTGVDDAFIGQVQRAIADIRDIATLKMEGEVRAGAGRKANVKRASR